MFKKLLLFATATAIMTGCSGTRPLTSTADIEPQCLGIKHDGSQTLRVSGFGKNANAALEQAYKNAIYAVLFKGITAGVANCDQRPLVPEVNARKRYEEYFDNFFVDNGPYKEFISDEDERLYGREDAKNSLGQQTIVVVRVLRTQLRTKLKHDGILK